MSKDKRGAAGEQQQHARVPPPVRAQLKALTPEEVLAIEAEENNVLNDKRDLAWSTVMKRTFESYIRGEVPNMYGEWLKW